MDTLWAPKEYSTGELNLPGKKKGKEDRGVCSMDGDRLLGLAFPLVNNGVHMFAYLKLGSTTSSLALPSSISI